MVARRRTVQLFGLTVPIVCFMFFCFVKYLNKGKNSDFHQTFSHWETTKDWMQRTDNRSFIDRLAALSLQLNAIQRGLQQIVCLGPPASGTSDTGGWCGDAIDREHRTDQGLARALSVLLLGRTAASLGDGLGEYGQAIAEAGLPERVDSFDGSPFVEEATAGHVSFFDLALPQFWLPVYDWTICLEVLEHVPARFEAMALDNVVRPARLGVVLSWARPGQNGFGHVNARPVDYVVEAMERRGFRVDDVWTTKLRDAAAFAWFKFTINVYRRTNESLRLFDWRTNWTEQLV